MAVHVDFEKGRYKNDFSVTRKGKNFTYGGFTTLKVLKYFFNLTFMRGEHKKMYFLPYSYYLGVPKYILMSIIFKASSRRFLNSRTVNILRWKAESY